MQYWEDPGTYVHGENGQVKTPRQEGKIGEQEEDGRLYQDLEELLNHQQSSQSQQELQQELSIQSKSTSVNDDQQKDQRSNSNKIASAFECQSQQHHEQLWKLLCQEQQKQQQQQQQKAAFKHRQRDSDNQTNTISNTILSSQRSIEQMLATYSQSAASSQQHTGRTANNKSYNSSNNYNNNSSNISSMLIKKTTKSTNLNNKSSGNFNHENNKNNYNNITTINNPNGKTSLVTKTAMNNNNNNKKNNNTTTTSTTAGAVRSSVQCSRQTIPKGIHTPGLSKIAVPPYSELTNRNSNKQQLIVSNPHMLPAETNCASMPAAVKHINNCNQSHSSSSQLLLMHYQTADLQQQQQQEYQSLLKNTMEFQGAKATLATSSNNNNNNYHKFMTLNPSKSKESQAIDSSKKTTKLSIDYSNNSQALKLLQSIADNNNNNNNNNKSKLNNQNTNNNDIGASLLNNHQKLMEDLTVLERQSISNRLSHCSNAMQDEGVSPVKQMQDRINENNEEGQQMHEKILKQEMNTQKKQINKGIMSTTAVGQAPGSHITNNMTMTTTTTATISTKIAKQPNQSNASWQFSVGYDSNTKQIASSTNGKSNSNNNTNNNNTHSSQQNVSSWKLSSLLKYQFTTTHQPATTAATTTTITGISVNPQILPIPPAKPTTTSFLLPPQHQRFILPEESQGTTCVAATPMSAIANLASLQVTHCKSTHKHKDKDSSNKNSNISGSQNQSLIQNLKKQLQLNLTNKTTINQTAISHSASQTASIPLSSARDRQNSQHQLFQSPKEAQIQNRLEQQQVQLEMVVQKQQQQLLAVASQGQQRQPQQVESTQQQQQTKKQQKESEQQQQVQPGVVELKQQIKNEILYLKQSVEQQESKQCPAPPSCNQQQKQLLSYPGSSTARVEHSSQARQLPRQIPQVPLLSFERNDTIQDIKAYTDYKKQLNNYVDFISNVKHPFIFKAVGEQGPSQKHIGQLLVDNINMPSDQSMTDWKEVRKFQGNQGI